MSELKEFHGKIMKLEGVDTYVEQVKQWHDTYEDCQAISFKLDGVTYTALEDPSDGYRSYMNSLVIGGRDIVNTFSGVEVKGFYLEKDPEATWDDGCDILQLIDTTTNEVVLSIGTANVEDYYPYFVGHFNPKAMSVNQN